MLDRESTTERARLAKSCAVDGCGKAPVRREWCSSHYRRWLSHGDPLGGGTFRKYGNGATPEERLWSRVDRSGGPDACWPWTGLVGYTGYGKMTVRRKNTPTHRFAFELTNGPIPSGLCVCHACDNRLCCNPAHLWLGTQMDNIQDRNAKGRQARGLGSTGTAGERHRCARLTDDQVLEMRALRATGMRTVDLARIYGVRKHHVSQITLGRKWRHLPGALSKSDLAMVSPFALPLPLVFATQIRYDDAMIHIGSEGT